MFLVVELADDFNAAKPHPGRYANCFGVNVPLDTTIKPATLLACAVRAKLKVEVFTANETGNTTGLISTRIERLI